MTTENYLAFSHAGRDVRIVEATNRFNRVKPAGNWKMPIDTTIICVDDLDAELVRRSIEFFAGGPATAQGLRQTSYGIAFRFTAPGYYAAIGA